MAYKMKYTDGKKASPAKFAQNIAGTLLTKKLTSNIVKKKLTESLLKKGLSKGIQSTIGNKLKQSSMKEITKQIRDKGMTSLQKEFRKGLGKKTLSLQEKILAKSKDKAISLSDSAREIKGVKPKVKKSNVKVHKPDSEKQTFKQALGDQALGVLGNVATNVATDMITDKPEEKVVNPTEQFAQMKFGNYPNQD